MPCCLSHARKMAFDLDVGSWLVMVSPVLWVLSIGLFVLSVDNNIAISILLSIGKIMMFI